VLEELGAAAIGKPFREVFPALADERLHAELDAVFGSGRATMAPEVPMPYRSAAGEPQERFVDLRLEPMTDEDGNVTGVACVALDVTERVRTRRQIEYLLTEMRRLNDELAHQSLGDEAPAREPIAAPGEVESGLRARIATLQQMVAHKDEVLARMTQELRTPLHVLMGFGGILRREVAGSLTPRQHDYLTKLLAAASVMATLIDSVLDTQRVARGELSLTPQILDFTELLEEAIAEQTPVATSRRHHIELDVSEGLPVLYADHERLHQVITQLLGNAIKFTPDGGRIRVRAREEGTRLLCEVEDSGPGIAPEALSHVFQPFSTLAPGLDQPGAGAGLGLSVSRAIAEAHGGTLQVETRAGVGSVFRLSLPTLGSNRFLGQRFPSR
jgi:signal transduction histidine kinase